MVVSLFVMSPRFVELHKIQLCDGGPCAAMSVPLYSTMKKNISEQPIDRSRSTNPSFLVEGSMDEDGCRAVTLPKITRTNMSLMTGCRRRGVVLPSIVDQNRRGSRFLDVGTGY